MLSRIVLDPARQLVGAQCSGTLLLAKLGLIGNLPACTDLITKPWVIEAGVEVLDAPFVAHGNVATAGGCLASQYLAAWMIARMASLRDAEEIIRHAAPVGEKDDYVARAVAAVQPFLSVLGPNDEQTVAFTDEGIENLAELVQIHKADPSRPIRPPLDS